MAFFYLFLSYIYDHTGAGPVHMDQEISAAGHSKYWKALGFYWEPSLSLEEDKIGASQSEEREREREKSVAVASYRMGSKCVWVLI